MDSTPLAAFRTALIAERDALVALHQSSADSRKVVELDQTTVGRLSRIDALQGQAMAQAAARTRQLRGGHCCRTAARRGGRLWLVRRLRRGDQPEAIGD